MRQLLKLIAIFFFAAAGQSSYADVPFSLDTVIDGSTPSSSAPWLTATFADTGSGQVTLELTNNMTSGLYVTDLLFNTPVAITSLSLPSQVNNVQASSAPFFDAGLKAGLFYIDVLFNANQFTSGAGTLFLTMSGTGLTADTFNTLSAPGGTGFLGTSYLMAAGVQGFSGGPISSIGFTSVSAVPEPQVYAMMGVGLLLMGFIMRRRK